MKISKDTGHKSAFDMLSVTDESVTFAKLAKWLPQLGHLDGDPGLARRIEVCKLIERMLEETRQFKNCINKIKILEILIKCSNKIHIF